MTELITVADVSIDNLLIEGTKVKSDIVELITAADVRRTVDGAPTLTINFEDPHGKLVSQGFYDQRITAQIDGKGFLLYQILKLANVWTLTFEDLAVAEMRSHTDPRSVAGGTMTRVEFARLLLSESPWIPLYVHPSAQEEVAKVQLARGIVASDTSGGTADPNFFSQGGGQGSLSSDQQGFASAVASSTGMDPMVVLSWIGAESGWNATKPSHNYLNIGPGRSYASAQAAGQATATLLQASIYAGIRTGIRQGPVQTINAIVASPWDAGHYGVSRGQSTLLTIYNEELKKTGSSTSAVLKLAQQNKAVKAAVTGTEEDTWTCIKRIFAAVNWRCYVDWDANNVASVYVGPDRAFLLGKPEISISEDSDGVDWIDFDFDFGKPYSTATITARAHRWQLPPGTAILLTETGLPNPWLVTQVNRSFYSSQVTVTCKTSEAELPEPDPSSSGGAVDEGFFGALASALGVQTSVAPSSDAASGKASGGGTGPWGWPTKGSYPITTRFGVQEMGHTHQGLDIAAPEGTSIIASRNGTVTFAGVQSGYGNVVYITHRDPSQDKLIGPVGTPYETRYGHMSVIGARRGMPVQAGQEIGKVGHTGDATGPHVHFEIRHNGTAIDPLPLMGGGDASDFVSSPRPAG